MNDGSARPGPARPGPCYICDLIALSRWFEKAKPPFSRRQACGAGARRKNPSSEGALLPRRSRGRDEGEGDIALHPRVHARPQPGPAGRQLRYYCIVALLSYKTRSSIEFVCVPFHPVT